MKPVKFALALLSIATLALAPGVQAQEVKRSITKISGDLYRFQNKFHYSVFLVTPDGVIATDPINAEAATYLKAELKKRFNQTVKYLIYSHDHRDHIAGGEVFADTATVVAHENAKAVIIGEKRPTAVPDVTFTDQMVIELGGKQVELTYVGPSHSDNMIVMRFPAERALFTVDFISVNRLPFKTMSDSYVPGLMEAIRKVGDMDFDILVPGHGPMGSKSDAMAHLGYVEDLHAGVLAGLRAGKSVDDLKQSVTLDEYKQWGQYGAWREMNIEGMAARVQNQRRGN